jgi:hypothetical protein
MLKIYRYKDLDETTKNQLNNFIGIEFGHIPIVKDTTWALPNWTIINYVEGEIATFYNIVERTVSMDKENLKVAGINNVITPKRFRGQGLSTKTLLYTKPFLFKELNVDLGLLLCADDLILFYNRIGWYKVDCPVFFDQPNEKKIWTANTMLLTKDRTLVEPKEIDLNGLPW